MKNSAVIPNWGKEIYLLRHLPTGLYYCNTKLISKTPGNKVKTNLCKWQGCRLYTKVPRLSWLGKTIWSHMEWYGSRGIQHYAYPKSTATAVAYHMGQTMPMFSLIPPSLIKYEVISQEWEVVRL